MSCFATFVVAVILSVALLIWRLATNPGLRFDNDLDVFLILGLALAGIVGYFRITRHLVALALFLIPMIAVMMAIGGTLSLIYPGRSYDFHTPLSLIHVLTIVGASVSLAAASVGGIVYLLGDRQLRRRGPTAQRWIALPPLGAVEKFSYHAVLVGFPLLTAAIITGVVRALESPGSTTTWAVHYKALFSLIAWLAYLPMLQVGLLPAFRGRKAAWLSVVAFALLLSVFVMSTWVSSGK